MKYPEPQQMLGLRAMGKKGLDAYLWQTDIVSNMRIWFLFLVLEPLSQCACWPRLMISGVLVISGNLPRSSDLFLSCRRVAITVTSVKRLSAEINTSALKLLRLHGSPLGMMLNWRVSLGTSAIRVWSVIRPSSALPENCRTSSSRYLEEIANTHVVR